MTHEAMIGARWFDRKQLTKMFPGEDLTDRVTGGRASGGYGCNVLDKITPHHIPQRADAAKKLAHSTLRHNQLCPVCER